MNPRKGTGINHNILAIIFPIIVALLLTGLVYLFPEIGIAPQETAGKVMLRVAIFFACWPLAIRFFGGWNFSVTENAKKSGINGIDIIAAAIIIGIALVVAK